MVCLQGTIVRKTWSVLRDLQSDEAWPIFMTLSRGNCPPEPQIRSDLSSSPSGHASLKGGWVAFSLPPILFLLVEKLASLSSLHEASLPSCHGLVSSRKWRNYLPRLYGAQHINCSINIYSFR